MACSNWRRVRRARTQSQSGRYVKQMKRVTNKRPPRVELRAGRRRQTRKTSSAASRPGAHAGPHSAGRRSRSGHAAAAAQPVAMQQRPDPQYVAAVKHFEIGGEIPLSLESSDLSGNDVIRNLLISGTILLFMLIVIKVHSDNKKRNKYYE